MLSEIHLNYVFLHSLLQSDIIIDMDRIKGLPVHGESVISEAEP